jgi:hypothetical protein
MGNLIGIILAGLVTLGGFVWVARHRRPKDESTKQLPALQPLTLADALNSDIVQTYIARGDKVRAIEEAYRMSRVDKAAIEKAVDRAIGFSTDTMPTAPDRTSYLQTSTPEKRSSYLSVEAARRDPAVLGYLQAGRTVNAINRFQAITGIELAQAETEIERMQGGG